MYFPQFHAIPENDAWWGKGFTDWSHVKSASPQFGGHYQPRIPRAENYYDQSQIECLRWQISLARQYGIHGFCHYHYWFDGKQLLETPTRLVLANPELDLPFCLSWANETWSRRWDGRDHQALIRQTHPPTRESWKRHYDYLIRAWTDPRAIKVNGKPVFAIYRPQRIEKIGDMLAYWRELAQADGLPGIYLIFQKQHELPDRKCLKFFDAQFQFQPFEAINSPGYGQDSARHSLFIKALRRLPERYQDLLRGIRARFIHAPRFYDYTAVWRQILAIRPDPELVTFPGAFADWDNSARYGKRAIILRGASPENFRKYFGELVQSMPGRHLPEDFIFFNAWNEWSEAAYLEPDQHYGYQLLEIVRDVLAASR
jgi:hypothetical protein